MLGTVLRGVLRASVVGFLFFLFFWPFPASLSFVVAAGVLGCLRRRSWSRLIAAFFLPPPKSVERDANTVAKAMYHYSVAFRCRFCDSVCKSPHSVLE